MGNIRLNTEICEITVNERTSGVGEYYDIGEKIEIIRLGYLGRSRFRASWRFGNGIYFHRDGSTPGTRRREVIGEEKTKIRGMLFPLMILVAIYECVKIGGR
jgi:hypothetical protein